MNIIIVGVGKIGYNLAKNLSQEGHSITAIDIDKNAVNQVVDEIDCLGIVGNAVVKSVLVDANIETTDILIACTASDEINMLTCLLANKFKKLKTIARIRDPEYTSEINYLKEQLKLSYTINPELAASNEINRVMKYSSAISSESFIRNKVNLLKVEVNVGSPLCGVKLYDIQQKFDCKLVLCIIERDDEIIIPSGNDEIKVNDKISFVADHDNAVNFFQHAGFDYSAIKSVMIIGGGKISYYLIKILQNNCSIKIIDSDKKVCEDLLETFPDISVVYADGSDKKILLQEGIENVDAFLSLTGIDEENIILSLFAKKMCDGKIFTKINRTNFSEVMRELDMGTIINPEIICSNIITKQVRSYESTKGSNIERFYKLCDDKVEALEFFINEESNITNIKLKDLKFRNNTLIACISRNNKIIIPNGNDVLKKSDSVVVITKNEMFTDITDIIE